MADNYEGFLELCGAIIRNAMNEITRIYFELLKKEWKLKKEEQKDDSKEKERNISVLKKNIDELNIEKGSLERFFLHEKSKFKIYGSAADLQGNYILGICESDAKALYSEWLENKKKRS